MAPELRNNSLTAGPPWLLDAGDTEGRAPREMQRWEGFRSLLSSAGARTLFKTDGDGVAILHASVPETYPHQERLRPDDEKPLLAALERLVAQFGS